MGHPPSASQCMYNLWWMLASVFVPMRFQKPRHRLQVMCMLSALGLMLQGDRGRFLDDPTETFGVKKDGRVERNGTDTAVESRPR
jgi:hypothetical protein